MAYRLKTIRFRGKDARILLQNENGPCPLLATANALLLKGTISFPSHCIRNNVASLDDVTNMLANHAISHNQQQQQQSKNSKSGDDAEFHFLMDELMRQIPDFQYGMDVNLKFTSGVTGYEYTAQMTCLDMWNVKLVHGWLLDPEQNEALYVAVGGKTYNELVERVIHAKEAAQRVEGISKRIRDVKEKQQVRETWDLLDDDNKSGGTNGNNDNVSVSAARRDEESASSLQQELERLTKELDDLNHAATAGTLLEHFLQDTGHQLTHYGLQQLYEHLSVNEVCIFFRNNHFATMTKHTDGVLYLLVTDLGYANSPGICWEKLDVIDGDTEYVNALFAHPGKGDTDGTAAAAATNTSTLTPEQLLAQSGQIDADHEMALRLAMQDQQQQQSSSQQTGVGAANASQPPSAPPPSRAQLDAQEGQLMEKAMEESLRTYHGIGGGGGGGTTTTATTAGTATAPTSVAPSVATTKAPPPHPTPREQTSRRPPQQPHPPLAGFVAAAPKTTAASAVTIMNGHLPSAAATKTKLHPPPTTAMQNKSIAVGIPAKKPPPPMHPSAAVTTANGGRDPPPPPSYASVAARGSAPAAAAAANRTTPVVSPTIAALPPPRQHLPPGMAVGVATTTTTAPAYAPTPPLPASVARVVDPALSQFDSDRLVAMQLQNDDDASLALARKLHAEEQERARQIRQQQQQRPPGAGGGGGATAARPPPQQQQPRHASAAAAQDNSGCVVS